MKPRRCRIRSLALAPWWIGIIAAVPDPGWAQGDTLAAAVAGTLVRVSRAEVTVTFPTDMPLEWGWRGRNRSGPYSWRLSLNDEGPPRAITLHIEPEPGRSFGSFEELVSAGEARVCWPVHPYCDGTRVRASARGGRLALSVRDSAAILELFGLRPEVATASLLRPGMREAVQTSVPVTYADPQVPPPDSAFRAAAAERRRRHFERVNRATRVIMAERPHGDFWLVVGDSATAQVWESRCSYNNCMVTNPALPDARWSVADSSVTRIQPAGEGLVRVFALRPGRTVLRATGLHGPRDTVPLWNPLPEEAEREVVVTLPVAAVRICPRGPVYADSPFPLHVEVVDSGGNVFRDPPIAIRWGNFPFAPSDTVSFQFQGRGSATFTTAFAGHADTLEVRVIPRGSRANPRDTDGCSPSALSSALLPARRPDD